MRIGRFEVELLDAGHFRMDGGMLFGVVPKVMWEKHRRADELNRIDMCTNSLLVRDGQRNLLIEAGMGTKHGPKERERWMISEGDELLASLRRHGLEPKDIDVVIQTHLHFDHAGGLTRWEPDGRVVPTFARARHLVQRREWDFAVSPDPRSRASFLSRDWEPVADAGLFDLVDGSQQIHPGIELRLTGGHTPGHQVVVIESNGEAAVFMGDLIPFEQHLRTAWVAATDLLPLQTLEEKVRLREEAYNHRYLVVFGHEPDHPWGHLQEPGDRLVPLERSAQQGQRQQGGDSQAGALD